MFNLKYNADTGDSITDVIFGYFGIIVLVFVLIAIFSRRKFKKRSKEPTVQDIMNK